MIQFTFIHQLSLFIARRDTHTHTINQMTNAPIFKTAKPIQCMKRHFTVRRKKKKKASKKERWNERSHKKITRENSHIKWNESNETKKLFGLGANSILNRSTHTTKPYLIVCNICVLLLFFRVKLYDFHVILSYLSVKLVTFTLHNTDQTQPK